MDEPHDVGGKGRCQGIEDAGRSREMQRQRGDGRALVKSKEFVGHLHVMPGVEVHGEGNAAYDQRSDQSDQRHVPGKQHPQRARDDEAGQLRMDHAARLGLVLLGLLEGGLAPGDLLFQLLVLQRVLGLLEDLVGVGIGRVRGTLGLGLLLADLLLELVERAFELFNLEASLEFGELLLHVGGCGPVEPRLDFRDRLLALGEEARALLFDGGQRLLGKDELLLGRRDGGVEDFLLVDQAAGHDVIGRVGVAQKSGDALFELGDLGLLGGDLELDLLDERGGVLHLAVVDGLGGVELVDDPLGHDLGGFQLLDLDAKQDQQSVPGARDEAAEVGERVGHRLEIDGGAFEG